MATYAVDIDGTLTKDTGDDWMHEITDFLKSKPDQNAIDKINSLYDAGHQIFIHTSRPQAMYNVTCLLLKHLKIKYHGLVMGKLKADFYVDARSRTIDEL